MKTFYTIKPDPLKVAAKIGADATGARRAGMINLVTEIEAVAKKTASVKTTNLKNSGTSHVDKDGLVGTVGFTALYAKHVHEGTGLYGPHRTKIVPKNKKALFWPGAAHPVRAVRGMKGNPFLVKAAQEADMEKLFTEGAQNYLNSQGS